jgi:hypothetical protein
VRYLLLLNNVTEEAQRWESLSAEERAELRAREVPRWNEVMGWIAQKGIEIEGLELDDPSTAKTVRVRDGEVVVTDGPHAETKEQIGGYFLLDLKDLDEAIEIARRIPVVDKGSVEIRPLVE